MVRLILIATAVFLALYLLSRRFNASPKSNEARDDVVGPRYIYHSGCNFVGYIYLFAVGRQFGRVASKSSRFLSCHTCAFTFLGLAHPLIRASDQSSNKRPGKWSE